MRRVLAVDYDAKQVEAHFETALIADKKSEAGPFLKVCEDFGVAPRQVVAIGDSSNDAVAARVAGCHVLSVPYGYHHGESVHGIGSDGIVRTLLEAAQLIFA